MRPPANCDCEIYFGNPKNPKKQFQNFGEKRCSAVFRCFIGLLRFLYGLSSGYNAAPHKIPSSSGLLVGSVAAPRFYLCASLVQLEGSCMYKTSFIIKMEYDIANINNLYVYTYISLYNYLFICTYKYIYIYII